MARTFRRTEEQMRRSVRGLGVTSDGEQTQLPPVPPAVAPPALVSAPDSVSAPEADLAPDSDLPAEALNIGSFSKSPASKRSRFRDSRRKPAVERVTAQPVDQAGLSAADLISEPPLADEPTPGPATFLERLAAADEPDAPAYSDATVQMERVNPFEVAPTAQSTEVAALDAEAVLESEVAALEEAEISAVGAETDGGNIFVERVVPAPEAVAPDQVDNPHLFRRRHIEIGTAALQGEEETESIPAVRASGTEIIPSSSESLGSDVPAEVAAVAALNASKIYGEGANAVRAIDEVSHQFPKGRFTAIMGPSGSGKSTLLHCLAGLDDLSSGKVFVGEVDVTALDEKGKTLLRRDKVGFIFQSFNLVPTLTAMENITLPMELAKREPDLNWVNYLVSSVGLSDRLDHLPSELSGGQQQRVAAVRALASKPAIVFADEPTGNLDSRRSGEVLEFLRKAVDEFGQTIVMVTHDPIAASYADSVVFLADGQIVEEIASPSVDQILDRIKTLQT